MTADLPILGICGWSNSGKTTLLETIIPVLLESGLRIVVIKHDSHIVEVDTPGKDSDRLFRSGADITLHGNEILSRSHITDSPNILYTARNLAHRYDLVLLEGFKTLDIDKIWLLNDNDEKPPSATKKILATFPKNEERVEACLHFINDWLQAVWAKTAVYGCVLIGGKSTRMGQPKHLLTAKGCTWLESTVQTLGRVTAETVIAGRGWVPESFADCIRITDIPDAKGPLAGLLAAMRWNPDVCWLVAACDMPFISTEAATWLLSKRRPGVWGIVPQSQHGRHEPLFAYYDFRARNILEQLRLEQDMRISNVAADHHDVISAPPIPDGMKKAWENINSPEELQRLTKN